MSKTPDRRAPRFEAMVFAAGLGTRMGALTQDRPKALVEVAGAPLLDHVARRLVGAGATRLVVNVSPFADAIEAHVAARDGYGVESVVLREPDGPLETGGGLRAARHAFTGSQPILLHNVDVLSDLDLADLVRAHQAGGHVATLAVKQRDTQRHLLFDTHGLLGRSDATRDLRLEARAPEGPVQAWPFCGIHVVDPSLPGRITETGVFSITAPYLRLAATRAAIHPYDIGAASWFDVGTPARREVAEAWLRGR